MRTIEDDPFAEPSPDEVPLANAPLVRVIALDHSGSALALRLPPPPEVLANALQDSIHRELGGARIGKSVRVKSDG